MRKSIFCASLGLLTALVISLPFGMSVLHFGFPLPLMTLPLMTGLIGLYICAYFYGRLAGKLIHRMGAKDYKIWLIGILLALSCVVTAALAGSSIYFFKELRFARLEETFLDYVFKPLVWITSAGFIPALIIGLIWAKQMKKEITSFSDD